MDELIQQRHEISLSTVAEAAALALSMFHDRDALAIESKGTQDWVSNADRSVERLIRERLNTAFPDDGIVGEEEEATEGSSGFVWVIDPIDGTTCFVNGIPSWCVVLACVHGETTISAVVTDPNAAETFSATRGGGAKLNGKPMAVSNSTSLSSGSVGVGHSTRISPAGTIALLSSLLDAQGIFRRSGSGALDLAYVAAGRLTGYAEPHMNAWDCLASMLLIEEAGGQVRPFQMAAMLSDGERVIAACPGVYATLLSMSDKAYEEITS